MSTPTLTSQPTASSSGAAGIEPAARSQRTSRDPESAEQFAAAVADVLTPTTAPGSGKAGQPARTHSAGHSHATARPTEPTQPAAQPTVAAGAAAVATLVGPGATSPTAGTTTGAPTGPVAAPVVSAAAGP